MAHQRYDVMRYKGMATTSDQLSWTRKTTTVKPLSPLRWNISRTRWRRFCASVAGSG